MLILKWVPQIPVNVHTRKDLHPSLTAHLFVLCQQSLSPALPMRLRPTLADSITW